MSAELSVEVVTVFNWVPKAEFCECSDRAVFVKGKEFIDQLKSCEFFKKVFVIMQWNVGIYICANDGCVV
jgi:hypothetical protein